MAARSAQQSWQGSKFTRPLSRFRRLCDLLTYLLSACHVSAPCTGTDSPTGKGGCSRRPQTTTRKSSAGRRTVHERDSNLRAPTYTDVFHVKHRPNSHGTAHSTGGGETPARQLTEPRLSRHSRGLLNTPLDDRPASTHEDTHRRDPGQPSTNRPRHRPNRLSNPRPGER